MRRSGKIGQRSRSWLDRSAAMTYPSGMQTAPRSTHVERLLERVLSGSRWVLAPIYVGLAASLVLVLISFGLKAFKLCAGVMNGNSDELIIGILSLIDLSLIANLILIVVWAGYENFVSRLDMEDHPDRPDWINKISYTDLKLKLMTSIVAISAIHVLEDFMHIDTASDRQLGWSLGIHMAFIISALLLAAMDKLSAPH
jgi:uncharacterized protein (TIGR00645 family)